MKLNNLQILRGISALLVCCFHFREALNFDTNLWGTMLFEKGSVGVPIFFVISGYIMVFSTKKFANSYTRSNIVSFLKKRVIRIIPLYYFLTVMWMILSGSLLFYLNFGESSRLLKSLLFLPTDKGFPVLYLGWSLNYEMFFYLIFAFSFLFKKLRYYFVILFFIILVILGSVFTFKNPFWIMATDFLNLYFIVGILLGLFLDRMPKNKALLFSFCFAAMCLFSVYFFQILPVFNEFLALFIVTVFVASFLIFDLFLKVKANSFLKMLGDISYSIYLSHPFVEIFFRRFQVESPVMIILLFVLKLAVVIVISKILYEVVEKRFTNFLKRKILPSH